MLEIGTSKSVKWQIAFIIFLLFILVVFILAYLGLIPTELRYIPWYDSIGHFVLLGILSYLLYRATNRRSYKIFSKINLPIGPVIIAVFATIEEMLQSLSINRNFSLLDLFFSLAGIAIFYLLDKLYQIKIIKDGKY